MYCSCFTEPIASLKWLWFYKSFLLLSNIVLDVPMWQLIVCRVWNQTIMREQQSNALSLVIQMSFSNIYINVSQCHSVTVSPVSQCSTLVLTRCTAIHQVNGVMQISTPSGGVTTYSIGAKLVGGGHCPIVQSWGGTYPCCPPPPPPASRASNS